MSDKIEWTVEATKLLINLYKTNPSLYDRNHKLYKNRKRRQNMLTAIAEDITNRIGVPCSVQDVKKKINGLRSHYQSEKLKVTRSLKNPSEGEQPYKPTVYWYPLLKFLDPTLIKCESYRTANSSSSDSESDATEAIGSSTSNTYSSKAKRKKSNSSSPDTEIIRKIEQTYNLKHYVMLANLDRMLQLLPDETVEGLNVEFINMTYAEIKDIQNK